MESFAPEVQPIHIGIQFQTTPSKEHQALILLSTHHQHPDGFRNHDSKIPHQHCAPAKRKVWVTTQPSPGGCAARGKTTAHPYHMELEFFLAAHVSPASTSVIDVFKSPEIEKPRGRSLKDGYRHPTSKECVECLRCCACPNRFRFRFCTPQYN